MGLKGVIHGAHREGDYITLKYARICYQVTTMLDCIIVGGGPVGLFAAAELQKQKRSFRLLEASDTLGGQTLTLYPEKEIVDIPGIPSIKAKDYIASLIQNIDPVNVSLGVKVLSYVREGETLSVTTSDGVIKAKNLLLATGLGFYKPRTMGLPDEEKYSNILYTLKDFNFLKGKKVVIFGGGDSALDWAKEISQISSFVSLVHRRTEFRGNPDTIKGRPVTLYLPYIPHALIESNGQLVGITIEEVNDHHLINLEVDYVLVNYGAVPSPSLLGLKPGPTFGALVNEHCEAEPHVFAVGDCCSYEGKLKRIAPGQEDVRRALAVMLSE